jgi:hypothetical protein
MGMKFSLKGRAESVGVWDQGAVEDIWAEATVCNTRVEKTTQWGPSWFLLLTKHSLGYKIKEDEMGSACGIYGEKRNSYMVLVYLT